MSHSCSRGLRQQIPANPGVIDRRGFEWIDWQRKLSSGYVPLTGHSFAATSVAFRHHGRWLASASIDGMVKLWDAASAREIRTLQGHGGAVLAVAFSPMASGWPPRVRMGR